MGVLLEEIINLKEENKKKLNERIKKVENNKIKELENKIKRLEGYHKKDTIQSSQNQNYREYELEKEKHITLAEKMMKKTI